MGRGLQAEGEGSCAGECTAEEFETDAGLCAHTLAAHASVVAAAAASVRSYAAAAAPSAAAMQRQQQMTQQMQLSQQQAQQQQLQQYLDATASAYASTPRKRSRNSHAAAPSTGASISRSQSTASCEVPPLVVPRHDVEWKDALEALKTLAHDSVLRRSSATKGREYDFAADDVLARLKTLFNSEAFAQDNWNLFSKRPVSERFTKPQNADEQAWQDILADPRELAKHWRLLFCIRPMPGVSMVLGRPRLCLAPNVLAPVGRCIQRCINPSPESRPGPTDHGSHGQSNLGTIGHCAIWPMTNEPSWKNEIRSGCACRWLRLLELRIDLAIADGVACSPAALMLFVSKQTHEMSCVIHGPPFCRFDDVDHPQVLDLIKSMREGTNVSGKPSRIKAVRDENGKFTRSCDICAYTTKPQNDHNAANALLYTHRRSRRHLASLRRLVGDDSSESDSDESADGTMQAAAQAGPIVAVKGGNCGTRANRCQPSAQRLLRTGRPSTRAWRLARPALAGTSGPRPARCSSPNRAAGI